MEHTAVKPDLKRHSHLLIKRGYKPASEEPQRKKRYVIVDDDCHFHISKWNGAAFDFDEANEHALLQSGYPSLLARRAHFWLETSLKPYYQPCTGCFESGEYGGLEHNYPMHPKHSIRVGNGCSECGYHGIVGSDPASDEAFIFYYEVEQWEKHFGEDQPINTEAVNQ